jgi:hypothetical protein
MGVLAQYLKTEVEHLRAEIAKRRENLDEWLAAISKLYDQLEVWLKEADSGLGILGTDRDSTLEYMSEPRLGSYEVKTMWVVLGGAIGSRGATIVPQARYVSAVIQPPGRESRRADGIVKITDGSLDQYYLFRWKTRGGDEWFIRSYSAWNADPNDNTVEPLDRDRFEAAILKVLQ